MVYRMYRDREKGDRSLVVERAGSGRPREAAWWRCCWECVMEKVGFGGGRRLLI